MEINLTTTIVLTSDKNYFFFLCRQYGCNWERMAEVLPNKSPKLCQQFFDKQRKRYELDKFVKKFAKVNETVISNS